MTEKSALEIPFAVHTAKYGYDWSSIPAGMTREELDAHYRQAAVLKPEFLRAGEVVSGVFAHDGRVVVYLIQVARGWDSNGRDAEYSAFAFLSYAEAGKVDFRALLDRDEFRVPRRDPPPVLRYAGPPAPIIAATDETTAEVRALCRNERLSAFDFRKIGAVIGSFGSLCDMWFFCSVKTAQGERVYATTAAKVSGAEPPFGLDLLDGASGSGAPQKLDAEHHPFIGTDMLSQSLPSARPKGDWVTVLIWLVSAVAVIVALVVAFSR